MSFVTCAVCGDVITEGVGTSCPECSVPYHDDCWAFNNSGCGIYGCKKDTAVVVKKYSRVRKICTGLFNRLNQDHTIWAPYYGAFYTCEEQVKAAEKLGKKNNVDKFFIASLFFVDSLLLSFIPYLLCKHSPIPLIVIGLIYVIFILIYSATRVVFVGSKNGEPVLPSFYPFIYFFKGMKWLIGVPPQVWGALVNFSSQMWSSIKNLLCELEKEGGEKLAQRDQRLLEEHREE